MKLTASPSILFASVCVAISFNVSAENAVETNANKKPEKEPKIINPLGVPEHFNITPTPELLDEVKKAMGGVSADEAAQAENALKQYQHAQQIRIEPKAIVDTYSVKLHTGLRYKLLVVSGFETEILFFDLNGNPWEVGSVSTGNTKLISATKGDVLSHGVTIAAADSQYAGATNLKVKFKGFETSVSFPITVNTEMYHETLKVVLPGTISNAVNKSHIAGYETRYAMDDPVARSVLDNPINPENSQHCEKRLAIAKSITGQTLLGTQPVVFSCDTGLYIRTRYLTAPNPQPNGFINGPDGYRVYRFLDDNEMFTFREKNGETVFVESVKPQKLIGARFGKQVELK